MLFGELQLTGKFYSKVKQKIWSYVIITSRTGFRVNLHSIVTWMSRNSLLRRDVWNLSDSNGIRKIMILFKIVDYALD